jgi:hypothetical protein
MSFAPLDEALTAAVVTTADDFSGTIPHDDFPISIYNARLASKLSLMRPVVMTASTQLYHDAQLV